MPADGDHAVATGVICAARPNAGRLATALLAAVEGGIMLAQVRRDPAPLETALDEVLDRIEDLRPRRTQAHQ